MTRNVKWRTGSVLIWMMIMQSLCPTWVVAGFFSLSREDTQKTISSVSTGKASLDHLSVEDSIALLALLDERKTAMQDLDVKEESYTKLEAELAQKRSAFRMQFNLIEGSSYFYRPTDRALIRSVEASQEYDQPFQVKERDLTEAEGQAYQEKTVELLTLRRALVSMQKIDVARAKEVLEGVNGQLATRFDIPIGETPRYYLTDDGGVIIQRDVDTILDVLPESNSERVGRLAEEARLAEDARIAIAEEARVAEEVRIIEVARLEAEAEAARIIAETPKSPVEILPEEAVWLYQIAVSVPDGCESVLQILADQQAKLAPKSQELPEVLMPVTLLDFVAHAQTSIDGQALTFRDQTQNGRLVTKESFVDGLKTMITVLKDEGYYLIKTLGDANVQDGQMTFMFDPGRIGKMTVGFVDEEGEVTVDDEGFPIPSEKVIATTTPEGRYFSADQVAKRFKQQQTGQVFNYGELFSEVSDANTHPDLIVDSELKVRTEVEDNKEVRYVDIDLKVQESLPLHGGVGIANDGTDQTGEWWMSAYLSYMNLTGNDDTLSFSVQNAMDDMGIYSLALNYSIAHEWRKGGAFSVFAGYSNTDIDDVIPLIGVKGRGTYFGYQYDENIWNDEASRLTFSIGQIHRLLNDAMNFSGITVQDYDTHVAPIYVRLGYMAKQLDGFAGRNFASIELSHNFEGLFGSSDQDEIELSRQGADANYSIARFQLARVQALEGFDRIDHELQNRWTLFTRVVTQVSEDPLVSAEQFALGGNATVRGYQEQACMGDDGIFGSLELRSPIYAGFVRRVFGGDSLQDRLQFVGFWDMGMVHRQDTVALEDDRQDLMSVGLGLRFAYSKHMLLTLDWGVPLTSVTDDDDSSMAHLRLNFTF